MLGDSKPKKGVIDLFEKYKASGNKQIQDTNGSTTKSIITSTSTTFRPEITTSFSTTNIITPSTRSRPVRRFRSTSTTTSTRIPPTTPYKSYFEPTTPKLTTLSSTTPRPTTRSRPARVFTPSTTIRPITIPTTSTTFKPEIKIYTEPTTPRPPRTISTVSTTVRPTITTTSILLPRRKNNLSIYTPVSSKIISSENDVLFSNSKVPIEAISTTTSTTTPKPITSTMNTLQITSTTPLTTTTENLKNY